MLEEIAGHERARALLSAMLEQETFPHALLISGTDAIGKTSLALAVASALAGASDWPGGLQSHPDIWIEDGESERLSINRIRAGGKSDDGPSLQEMLSLRPYVARHRIAVIARAERLTEDAANSLLKTLEEPPPNTHLLLTTAAPERLPATIVSRCRQLYLGLVSAESVNQWLLQLGVGQERAATIAPLAAGRPGRAYALARDDKSLESEMDQLRSFAKLDRLSVEDALLHAGRFATGSSRDDRDLLLQQLSVWASFIRDALSTSLGLPDLVRWLPLQQQLQRWAALGSESLVARLGACLRAMQDIANYAQPRLTLEALFLSFAAPA